MAEDQPEKPAELTRRGFLKGLAATLGVGALVGGVRLAEELRRAAPAAAELPFKVIEQKYNDLETPEEKIAFLAGLYILRGVNPFGGEVPLEKRAEVSFDMTSRLLNLDKWGLVSISRGSSVSVESAEAGDIIILELPATNIAGKKLDLDGTIASPFHRKMRVVVEHPREAAFTILTYGKERVPIECLVLFSEDRYAQFRVERHKTSPLSKEGPITLGLYSVTGFFVIPLSERGRKFAELKVDDPAFEQNRASLEASSKNPNLKPGNDYGSANNQKLFEWAKSLRLQ